MCEVKFRRSLMEKIQFKSFNIVLLLLGIANVNLVGGYPLHASCSIQWTFGENCENMKEGLVKQIELWRTNANCGTGQKCLYNKISLDGNVLKAIHTTPVRKYIDDLTFTFQTNSKTKGCDVTGFSTSRTWYAVLDFGTNYCNLHNLIEGAGYTKDKLYSEQTSDRVCTQYTSRNCEKY